MAEVKCFIGKNPNCLYEETGEKRSKQLEHLDFNTRDEIKNPDKIDYLPLLQYW